MFTSHHAEKLTPVAGGTSDMPPKTIIEKKMKKKNWLAEEQCVEVE
jgi:hypothetical protein